MAAWRPRVVSGEQRTHDGITLVDAGKNRDDLLSALAKWVPIEIIAFYEAITTPFGNNVAPFLCYAIGAGIAATFLWTIFATEDDKADSKIAWRQVILSTIAFAFWAVGTISPDVGKQLLSAWHPAISPVALAAGAIVLPIANGILRRMGVPQD